MTSTTYSHTRNFAPKDYADGDTFYEPETTLGLGDKFVHGLLVVAAIALAVGFYAWVLA